MGGVTRKHYCLSTAKHWTQLSRPVSSLVNCLFFALWVWPGSAAVPRTSTPPAEENVVLQQVTEIVHHTALLQFFHEADKLSSSTR